MKMGRRNSRGNKGEEGGKVFRVGIFETETRRIRIRIRIENQPSRYCIDYNERKRKKKPTRKLQTQVFCL